MQDYLKKYMDPPSKQRDAGSRVVYRSGVPMPDSYNIDIAMGRLVDQNQEDDLEPVLVETNESKKISQAEKKKVLENLTKKIRGTDRSRSRSGSKSQSQSSSSSDGSSDSESDSEPALPVQRIQQPGPTVYRDKTGQQISMEDKIKEDEEKQKQRRLELGKTNINQRAVEANNARIGTWGRGLVQQQKEREEEHELANQGPKDEMRERDLHLIRQEKFADPMRNIIQQDEQASLKINKKVGKKSKFPTIPNRYGIEAGHRWDGVDRSNGYERKYISTLNEKRETKTREALDHLKQL